MNYILAVNNVRDISPGANAILTGSLIPVRSLVSLTGKSFEELWEERAQATPAGRKAASTAGDT